MKKLYLIIFLLIIVICFSYAYLKNLQKEKHPFVFKEGNAAFLYQKKDIILNSIEEFSFDDFFSFIGNKPAYRYSFTEGEIIISIDKQSFIFPYQIREPEKEIIDKVVIKEIYKDKTDRPVENNDSSVQGRIDQKYFNIRKDFFSFPEGSDLSLIISGLSEAIDTNEKIIIDYSKLNPNEKGRYEVYLSSEKHSATIVVEII